MRTFSKIQGLANLRIGYGLAPEALASILQKTRQPFNANGIAQAGALAGLEDAAHMKRLAAGGFRDLTRIASSNPDLWAGIAADGAATLKPALDAYIRVLLEFRDRLGPGAVEGASKADRTGLAALFEEGRSFRDALTPGGRGALESAATLVVQIDDRTGAIGRIATTLGDHGIGIRNLGIVNSRGYEGGCLHVLLDEVQLETARRVLQEDGYECV